MSTVFVSDSFDDLGIRDVRFLEEASRLGPVHVLLWSDAVVQALSGEAPTFPQAERQYFLESIRYVDQVTLLNELAGRDQLPATLVERPAVWAVLPESDNQAKSIFCQMNEIDYLVIWRDLLQHVPKRPLADGKFTSPRKRVIVTGCYDWLHSGHVRFFEEAAQLGDLHVVIGSDANVRLLKGDGHPLFDQDHRSYMVRSIRCVAEVRVSSGTGWMDAEPEIEQIRPDLYVVNEDGDKPEKREFCRQHGLEYVVFKRLPKEGLPRRESTELRGF